MPTDKTDFKKQLDEVRNLDDKGAVAGYLDDAQRIVVDFPKHAMSWMELGIALTYVARYDEALKALNKSVRLMKPKFRSIPYALKGDLFKAKGSYRSAEQWYRKAIEVQPRNANWWAYLGSILAKQGRLTEAKEVWRKQIKLSSGATEEGHLNLGYIYRSEQKYKFALRQAEKAIAIDPYYKEAKLLREDLIYAMSKDK